MTLDEYFAQMDADGGYTVGDVRHTLAGDLAVWGGTSPGAGWLVSLMERDGPATEATVRKVLACWSLGGRATLAGIDAFAAQLRPPTDPLLLHQLLRPRLALDRSQWEWGTANDFRDAFWAQHDHLPDMQQFNVDGDIPRIPREQLATIKAWWAMVSSDYQYVPAKQPGRGDDCDGWGILLRAEASRWGYGEVFQVIRSPIHAFNAVWLTGGTIQLIEPQRFELQVRGYTGPATGLLW